MDKHEKRARITEYKQKARTRYKRLVTSRKKRRGLPIGEQFNLWRQDRQADKRWKQKIKAVKDSGDRKAQKKGYKLYKKLLRRKYVVATWVIVTVVVVGLFGSWLYGATRPLTAEQRDAREHSLRVAREVMDEGIVLLRNEHHTLPLTNKAVSVFGASAAKPVYGGGGAGGIAAQDVKSLYTAFGEAGIQYDTGLYNVYNNYVFNGMASTNGYTPPTGRSILDTLLPNIAGFMATTATEMPAQDIPEEVLTQAKKHSDTAVYVISRVGTETKDLQPSDLQLNDNERATLELMDKHFAHVVVLMNTTNAFELGFVNELKHVDSVLWIGAPGEVGTASVADVLLGNVNPSGRLTDTYAYDVHSNPAVRNTGNFQYIDGNGKPVKRYFVNYQEGIYVGYRYYETFVDPADYDKVVQYPFGYGLSYSSFDWKVGSTVATGDTIRANVTVTNTGHVAGKDVVQVYYTPPFTAGGIEKPAIALGGYAKTTLLRPGESQTVTVEFTTRSMASYDDKDAKAYVLDAGSYQISIARNVHDIVDKFTYTQPAKQVFATDSATGNPITNRFDDARGNVTYLSRSNPAATQPTAPKGDGFVLPSIVTDSDYVHQVGQGKEPTLKAKNNIKLKDLKGLEYSDPKWQQFLDQFSQDELVHLAGNGGYWSIGINRLGIPRTSMYDGPASIRNFLQAWATVAYPIPVNLSATWNTELAETVGQAMGKEAQSFNVDAVYAPSINLHRSPLGGRNFEYYSEDPLVAGTFGAAWTRGLQSTRTVAVMKHFVANDQETNRANFGLYTWMNEQSLRELYLKPFEITAKQGNAHGVMTAFNRIGAIWAGGSKPLLTDVLRNEWGFKGFVITDAGIAGQGDHFDALQAVEAGNDLMLAFIFDAPGNNQFESQLYDYLKQDRAGTLTALRNAAHNISYYVLQTSKVE